jgi:hypothetical protein
VPHQIIAELEDQKLHVPLQKKIYIVIVWGVQTLFDIELFEISLGRSPTVRRLMICWRYGATLL